MTRVRFISWRSPEAGELVSELETSGYSIDHGPVEDQETLRRLREREVQAIVIDLQRRPAQGRDLGIWLRQQKPTRGTPLVFVGGEPEKVERIRRLLPDAVYCDRAGLCRAVKRALDRPPANPVVPESAFAGYSGTPLPKKLGIKAGFTVALVSAPDDFDTTLGALPEAVELRLSGRGRRDLTLCFVRSRQQLRRRMNSLLKAAEQGHVWIAWPKKASSLDTDLTQTFVRQTGLDSGLVDFKICAIDATWSGLCFALRRK